MKLTSLTAPLLIAALSVATLSGLGLLAVRASAVSTRTNIELLRMNLRIARLHDQLLQHSQGALAAQLESLPPHGSVPAALAAVQQGPRRSEVPIPLDEASAVRPWPEGAAETAETAEERP